MIAKLKSKIKNKIWDSIKEHFYFQRVNDSPLLMNINYSKKSDQKKALICYLVTSYFTDWEYSKSGRTQPLEILKIVSSFTDLGYGVDLIGYKDLKALNIVRNRKYDVIFGFGEAFYQMTNIKPEAVSVYFMTENPPEFSYKQEKERLDYYFERHGKRLNITRSGKFYKIHHSQKPYTYIITMGETELLKKQYVNPYFIFPTGIINPEFCFKKKMHENSRKNFLWLGSTGSVHKGLDLLLDIFNQRRDIVLHICGLGNKERRKLRITKRENIIEYGHIDIKSRIFLDLADQCTYLILPSCSEACSTSVTTGMLHGLIPVVLKNTGFNRLEANAIFLEDFKIGYLNSKLSDLISIEPEVLDSMSEQVYNFARHNFTICNFENSFKKILADILRINISHSGENGQTDSRGKISL